MLEITEVRVKLMGHADDRLRAFCSITFNDAFVIRDLKVIEGSSGPFVAMPSRKLNFHCSRCGGKNSVGVSFCNDCGTRIRDNEGDTASVARDNIYTDVAHPINSACRDLIQQHVVKAYEKELARADSSSAVSRLDPAKLPSTGPRAAGCDATGNGSDQVDKTDPKRSGPGRSGANGVASDLKHV